MNQTPFFVRLRASILKTGTSLCLGIDPLLENLPQFLTVERQKIGDEEFLNVLCQHQIDAAAGLLPAVKFQSAFFEAVGAAGMAALKRSVSYAKLKGLLTVLDAKRGDISSTMKAYGVAAFDGIKADALTVNPYMGFDVIEPLSPWLKDGRGVFVVWLTSNQGAATLQDAGVGPGSESFTEYLMRDFEARAVAAGLSDSLGWVFGATRLSPGLVKKYLQPPARSFLLPGVGAQGAQVDALLKSLLAANPSSLVPMSRGLGLIGDPAFSTDKLASWQEYGARVRERMIDYRHKLLAS